MNKKTSVILKSIFGIIVLGILSIGIKYALDQRKIGQEEFEESERILGRAKTEASEWDAEFDKLEDKKSLIEAFLDNIIAQYPETEAAKNAELFRGEYVAILETAKIESEAKRVKEKKAEEEAAAARAAKREEDITTFIQKTGTSLTDNIEYWFDYFNDDEKSRLYRNEVKIGDRHTMVLFLKGIYKTTTSETADGTYNHFYGRTDARYSYITSANGKIDYIAY
jgi:hypothetical protein